MPQIQQMYRDILLSYRDTTFSEVRFITANPAIPSMTTFSEKENLFTNFQIISGLQ